MIEKIIRTIVVGVVLFIVFLAVQWLFSVATFVWAATVLVIIGVILILVFCAFILNEFKIIV